MKKVVCVMNLLLVSTTFWLFVNNFGKPTPLEPVHLIAEASTAVVVILAGLSYTYTVTKMGEK